MISKTAEYAVCACLWLARHPGRVWTVHHIAAAIHVPAKYLGKVMQRLGRVGLVRAQPGPGGGFALSQTPSSTCVLDVVRAVDPLPRAPLFPAAIPGRDAELHALHARLDQAAASLEDALRNCTLADLLPESTHQFSQEGSEP